MQIWLVNPFDFLPGEQYRTGRYAYFAKMLSEAGHSVVWWTSAFSHFSKSYRRVSNLQSLFPYNIKVNLLQAPSYSKNISLRRLINHFLWAQSFYRLALCCKKAPDVIIVSSPPLLSGRKAIQLGRKLLAKVIIDVQDMWPEAFAVALPRKIRGVGQIFLGPLRSLANSNYRDADAIIAVSSTYFERARGENRGIVIPLGVELDGWPDPPKERPQSPFRITYIGSMGRSYDLDTILMVASELMTIRDIVFTIAGEGIKKESLLKIAQQKGLANVELTGWLPYDEMIQLLQRSHIGLNPILPHSMISWPNKIFDYFAAGLPVISSVKGELESFIKNEGVGLYYEAGNVSSLKEAILALYCSSQLRQKMGVKSRQLVEERFDRRISYIKLLGLIENLTKVVTG